MTDTDAVHPLFQLSAEEKANLAGSFGSVASQYERYRPGPSVAAVDWMLPEPVGRSVGRSVGRIVDLGAGTGALTRILIDRTDDVVAVEPDDEMRAVLSEQVPEARAVPGRGEAIPLPDACADAVLASSSWHWMEPVETAREVARVLVPGGTLGVVWSGPDPNGAFLTTAQSLLAERAGPGREGTAGGSGLGGVLGGALSSPEFALEIPDGAPLGPPEHEDFAWDVAMGEDALIGLLGTFSWIITMDDDARARVLAEARALLREFLEAEGTATVDVAFAARAWRSRRDA